MLPNNTALVHPSPPLPKGTATLCARKWASQMPSSRRRRRSRGTSGSLRWQRRRRPRRQPMACHLASCQRWAEQGYCWSGVSRSLLYTGGNAKQAFAHQAPVKLHLSWRGRLAALCWLTWSVSCALSHWLHGSHVQVKNKMSDAFTTNWLPPLGATGGGRGERGGAGGCMLQACALQPMQ